MTIDRILIPLLLLYGVLTVGGFVLHFRLLRTLRREHPQVWRSLGSPTLVWNSSMANQRAVRRFLQQKEYLALEDPALTSLAEFIRRYDRISLPFFFLILVLLLFGQPLLNSLAH